MAVFIGAVKKRRSAELSNQVYIIDAKMYGEDLQWEVTTDGDWGYAKRMLSSAVGLPKDKMKLKKKLYKDGYLQEGVRQIIPKRY
jgi:hypothetical protein